VPRNCCWTRGSRASAAEVPEKRHAAGLQDIRPVGERERVVDVLLDEEDRHALLPDPLQRRENLPHEQRREAERRLVQEKEAADAP
jgi:hypothetical protein